MADILFPPVSEGSRVDLLGAVARLRRRMVPSGTVVERAVRSGMWEGGMNTTNRLIQLVKVAILARLLPPEEFGILGIGFLVLAAFKNFSQLGIDQALIQRQENQVDEYLNTTWGLQIARGALLTGVMFVTAPVAASWFGEPRATDVIRVLSVGPLLLGFKNPGIVYFEKNLQFHRRFVQVLSGTTVNFSVAVVLGFLLGNVWALVAGSVAGNVTSLVASYALHGYRPRPSFDLERARELIDYGKWIFGASITAFLTRQGDDVFVGWFLGATPLAFYQMAYRFSNAPATELTSVVSRVAFPSYSEVQDDDRKLRTGYFRTLRLTTFLAVPAAVGIAVVAPTFVRALLGTEWLPTIPIMQALAAWGALRALGANNRPAYNALSRPDINMKLGIVRIALIAIAIYPAADRFGLLGVATTIVAASAVVTPIGAYVALQLINGTVSRYLRTLTPPVVGSAVMGIVVWGMQESATVESPLLELPVLVAAGIAVYAAFTVVAMWLFDYRINNELEAIVQSLR